MASAATKAAGPRAGSMARLVELPPSPGPASSSVARQNQQATADEALLAPLPEDDISMADGPSVEQNNPGSAQAATEDDEATVAFLAGALPAHKAGAPAVEMAYHIVQGKEVWGLIWDPGAADGLCGTQTLLEYAQTFLYPHGWDLQPVARSGHSSFAGIDGQPMPSRLRASFPVNLGNIVFTFEADTIGASGDVCPMLLSNKSAV